MAEPFELRQWYAELLDALGPEGRALITPVGLAHTVAKYIVNPERKLAADDLDARDPAFVAQWMRVLRPVAERYFRWQVSGIEHVPREGPVLLVGSHNGGIVVSDSALTVLALWDHLGPSRPVYSLSHDLLHTTATLRSLARRGGILRAGHTGAERALRAGHITLVYPGSDLDSTRAFSQRYKIELGGRKGFLKLALRTGVPIVPVVSAGTHEQFVVLTRGDGLAKLLRTRSWLRLQVFPIVLSLPWGLTSGLFPYVPLPVQTSLAFGPAIRWPSLSAADADDPAVLDRCYAEVRDALQREMDVVAKGRLPFLGRV
ncbi:MAG: lysophospholipid acyltransferase family protein [Deltaproteobacteria bacterium]|nr:lysophospholipid acyltransferase family protein [Deltaproteobacteria bacterium]